MKALGEGEGDSGDHAALLRGEVLNPRNRYFSRARTAAGESGEARSPARLRAAALARCDWAPGRRGRGDARPPRGGARRRAGGCWEGCARRAAGGRGGRGRCRRRERACASEPEAREEAGAPEAAEGAGRVRRHVRSPRPPPSPPPPPRTESCRLRSLGRASGSRRRPGPRHGLCCPLGATAPSAPGPAVSELVSCRGPGRGRRPGWPPFGPFPLAPRTSPVRPGASLLQPGLFVGARTWRGRGRASLVGGRMELERLGHPGGSASSWTQRLGSGHLLLEARG